MKIEKKISSEPKQVDLTDLYLKFSEEYTEVFMYQIGSEVFLYRQLGRKDHKDLIALDVDDYKKEELLCETCVLYPENYDFSECDAGIPTSLTEVIIKNSFLDSLESRQLLINYSRQEMNELDNQVDCLIHEAFPEYTLDEIEEWDLQKTAKMLSRAEWVLANLRNATFSRDPFTGQTIEELQQQQQEQAKQEASREVETTELGVENEEVEFVAGETIEERAARIGSVKTKKKNKMTPEELDRLARQYPEMSWGANVLEEVTVDNLREKVGGPIGAY